MQIKKKPLTLIEIAISFSLISIIVFILFSCFRNSSTMTLQIEKVKPIVLEKQLFYQRLNKIFSFLDPNSIKELDPKIHDFSGITFTFNNGLDSLPAFSDQVLANIFLNNRSELILQIISIIEKIPPKEEILQKNVTEISWDLNTADLLVLKIKKTNEKDNSYAFFLPKTLSNGYTIPNKKEKT